MAASWSETLNMATAMVETVVGVVPEVVDSVMPLWTTQPARTHRELVRQVNACLLSGGGRRVQGPGRSHPPRDSRRAARPGRPDALRAARPARHQARPRLDPAGGVPAPRRP